MSMCLVLFFKTLKVITSSRLVKYYEKANESMFTCCGWRLKKLEVIIFASLFSHPLIFDLILLTTNSYGPYELWCWIHNIESDCSSHIAGLWEQVWLLIVPFGFIVLLALVLFTTLLCLYGTKSSRIALIEVLIVVCVFILAVMLTMWWPSVLYQHFLLFGCLLPSPHHPPLL